MSRFDPAAATAAYLAQMSPAEHERAVEYTRATEWHLLFGWLASLFVAWLIVRSGVLTTLRDVLNDSRPRPWATAFLLALVYGLMAWVLGLPWAVYSDWWFEKQYGLTSQPLVGFLGDGLKLLPFSLIFGAVFLTLLYALLRGARRTWWIWGGGLSAVFIAFGLLIAPVVIEPMLNTYTPAPAGPVRDEVVRLGRLTGTPTDKIYVYDGSRQSNRYTANVSGLGGTARIALSDVMFKKGADLAEVRGVVGHEMGHYVRQHALWFVGAFVGIAAIGFALMGVLFPLFRALLGARDVDDLSDPAGLPVLFAVLSTLSLLATPLVNTIVRTAETDADAFSLRYAREPDGLAEALIKTAEYRAPSPEPWEEFLFYDHPSVENRIRRAMEWKAANMPAAALAAEPAVAAPALAGPDASGQKAASGEGG